MTSLTSIGAAAGIALLSAGLIPGPARADIVHGENVIINNSAGGVGSLCTGFNCADGEAFGFDTIRLKEDNLRIHFDDISATMSFPNNDWRIVINDVTNGGAAYFAIEDATASLQVFRIEAGAPASSLYVDAQGDIGIGTATPALEVHILDGDSPTIRIEQNASGGFPVQTWDIVGNDDNFFIRDITNGQLLPFRIFPGAPTNALTIEALTGHIGLGTISPTALLSLVRGGAGADGLPRILFDNTDATSDWIMDVSDTNKFRISVSGSGSQELQIDNSGNLTVLGDINSGGTTVVPDYVFGEDYELMPLSEVAKFIAANRHLPNIPSADDVKNNGLNMTEMQMALLEKIEELTLYALHLNERNQALQEEVSQLRSLESRIAELESRQE